MAGGISIGFTGDTLEEVHEALVEYAKEKELIESPVEEEAPKKGKGAKNKNKKSKSEDDDDLSSMLDDDNGTEEEEETTDEEEETDEEADALREKLKKFIVAASKKEGGPDKVRAALKKIKAPKLSEVPNSKLEALEKVLKEQFKK